MNDILDATAFPQLAALIQDLPSRMRAVQPVWTELEQVAHTRKLCQESLLALYSVFFYDYQANAMLQRNRTRALTALVIHREQVEIVLDAATNERCSGLTEPVRRRSSLNRDLLFNFPPFAQHSSTHAIRLVCTCTEQQILASSGAPPRPGVRDHPPDFPLWPCPSRIPTFSCNRFKYENDGHMVTQLRNESRARPIQCRECSVTLCVYVCVLFVCRRDHACSTL
jgi:hypothetical protein